MAPDAAPRRQPSGRLEVGHVGRPQGLRGEVNVSMVTDRAERAEPGAELYAGDRRLVVEASRRQGQRLIVAFVGVNSRDDAEALRGAVLQADPLEVSDDDDDDVFWVHQLIGAEVCDRDEQVIGTVTAVQANPAHDLLVLGDGTLIPMVFVVEHSPGRVVIDPPAGLLDP